MDMTKEELSAIIEVAVARAVRAHVCVFTAEEKQLLKDVATGGKAFKRAIIYMLVAFMLIGIGVKYFPAVEKALGK